MPLPQQVIDRLSKEPPRTPGWSVGLLTFSAGICFITVLAYLGLAFGYEPYLDSQISGLDTQASTLTKAISASDQARVITFYSEITNIKNALAKHVALSRAFSWLEANTEQNTYWSKMSVVVEQNQVTLSGLSKTEADVNQQIAIFEAAPAVKNVSVSSVSPSDTSGMWQFSVALTVDPVTILRASSALAATPQ